ncbi:MAG: HEPN domain-containing protein [Coprothermobacterota bacterium]|jgi:HEPN domain-containing protein|nr:HEPN domain-containing protein [Coprothermobacterota bacterium]
MNRAKSDLAIASAEIEGVYLEDLCYHAQQAVEKSLKAILLARVGSFPYIHDLAELVNRIQQAGVQVPEPVRSAVALTEYAVGARYPGLDEPVTRSDWEEALNMANEVLNWAVALLEKDN